MGRPPLPHSDGGSRTELSALATRGGGHSQCGRGSAGTLAWGRPSNRLAFGGDMGSQGVSGRSWLASAAPGFDAGIRAAAQRAGAVFNGAVFGLGHGIFFGARRPAGTLRKYAIGSVVSGGDPDHDGVWRRV